MWVRAIILSFVFAGASHAQECDPLDGVEFVHQMQNAEIAFEGQLQEIREVVRQRPTFNGFPAEWLCHISDNSCLDVSEPEPAQYDFVFRVDKWFGTQPTRPFIAIRQIGRISAPCDRRNIEIGEAYIIRVETDELSDISMAWTHRQFWLAELRNALRESGLYEE